MCILTENRHPDNKLVENSVTTFPEDDEHLVNYVVARPDNKHPSIHAEKFLLCRFEALQTACQTFSTIVVYSWLMPCQECTNTLIETLSKYVQKYEVVIVYNTDQKGKDDENRESRSRLHQADIQVFQVKYNHTLPR